MILLPGRSDAPSRLNRTKSYIPVTFALLAYNFRQAPEGIKATVVLQKLMFPVPVYIIQVLLSFDFNLTQESLITVDINESEIKEFANKR